jgi:hypothetical protein
MRTSTVTLLACLALVPAPLAGAPPSPQEFLGFPIGADRQLADYEQIGAYLQALDAASDRVELREIGRSTLDRPIWMAVISAPANLAAAGRHREVARRLADPRDLSPQEEAALVAEGRAIVLVTCNIHATEIGSSQMALELAWELATTTDPAWARILGDVILLLLPSINPDGQQMEVDWYRKWLGTEYEGGSMPWLYHHHAGHDNNRDWFMLNLPETRALNRVLYREWFPQVYLDEHQMGSTGPRIFVPPFHDPIAANIHPLIWRLADLFGTEMAVRLQEAGKSGVIDGYAYDGYWPGGTMNTAWWKNVVGLLTELASASMATPVTVDPNELRGARKGLPEYRSQINFPDPWPGGLWTLRDIVDYELIATRALLETASRHREDLLRDAARMARDAVRAGGRAPFAYAVPPGQRDPVAAAALVDLLLEHGVEVHRATADLRAGDIVLPAGTVVVRMDQPYRAFAKEMLEAQRFPEVVTTEDGEILRPYDVTGWTLPLLMGVEGLWLDEPVAVPLETLDEAPYPAGQVAGGGERFLLSRASNAAAQAVNRLLAAGAEVRAATSGFEAAGKTWPAGTYLVSGVDRQALQEIAAATHTTFEATAAAPGGTWARVRAPRVGLYQPWAASMDEGWTRLVLERHGYTYETLHNADVKAGGLADRFDAVVLPDVGRDVIVDGRRKPTGDQPEYHVDLPPDYQGGIGKEGVDALKAFVEAGGTLVALDSSGALPIAEMNLPVRDVLDKVPEKEFLCPGSLLRVGIDVEHPLGYGMPAEAAAFFASSPAYATSIPGGEASRHVVARYPDAPLLLSGFLRGEDRLRRRAAIVEVDKGKGRVDLFGFRVQNRAWTTGTFRLLFNALERSAWEQDAP